GYVLRRIMRRAMRHAHMLGATDPMIYALVPTLIHEMGDTFSELRRAETLITETIKLEEVRFGKTLSKGLGILADATKGIKKGGVLSGDVAFKLYDTYGFPLDLTEDALRARNISVDNAAFSKAMEKQKSDARKAWKGSGDQATETVWFDIRDATPATEFLGYDALTADGKVMALVKDGKSVKTLKAGDTGHIVVNQTPFYGESGGQVGDQGRISGSKTAAFRVDDTQKKLASLFVHAGEVEAGGIKIGDTVTLSVDPERRQATRANHSATHLLHEALRQVLGTHVVQKGSLVAPDRLRFDFSHPKSIAPDELTEIEDRANAVVDQNAQVETHLMSYDEALATGAMALFGEKYGDEVRVVSMGAANTDRPDKSAWSIELCGGTHVDRTGDIGTIRVVSESASAAGVRRIEALTGRGARAHLAAQDDRIKDLAGLLKTKPEDVVARVKALADERKALERAVADAKKQAALSAGGAGGAINIAGIKFLKLSVADVASKDLKAMADEARARVGSGVVAVANAASDGKLGIVVAVTPDKTDTFSAVDLVRLASESVGGKGGGGRPDLAQAGGPDGAQAEAALAAIEEFLKSKM
nr:alanine--tRNA ligase [Alphaproteobacteria bacterium]